MSVSRSRRVRFIRPFGLAILLGALIGVPAAVARVDAPEAASPVVAAAAAASTRVAPASVEPAALGSGQLTVVKVTGSLSSPLGVTNAGDGSGRLFVVEQSGRVRIVKGGKITGTFLDLRSRTDASGERGLLGLAFHPDFPTNGYVYAYYTTPAGSIRISRYTANAARTFASLTTEYFIITIPHPTYANHNGGGLAFGPDGYLYAAVGDGGSANDPGNNGQDKDALLGRSCASTSTAAARASTATTGSRPITRSWVPREPTRSGIGVCAIRGASRSIAPPATCTSAMSARVPGRKSTSRTSPIRAATTMAGGSWKGPTAACPAAPHRRTTSCRSPSTRTASAARSRVATSIADRTQGPAGAVRLRRLLQRPYLDDERERHRQDAPPRHQPQHLVVRRERGRRAVPDRPERIALSRHRARVQRHRQLELHRRHPLVVLPGHHGRVRQRQVLPEVERHARPDGAVPRPRLQPSTARRPTTSPTTTASPARARSTRSSRPGSRSAASRITSARRARSPARRWRSSSSGN